MSKVQYIATNFTAGALSPKVRGRVDLERYSNGAKVLHNCYPVLQGGVKRRPGTRYVLSDPAPVPTPCFQLNFSSGPLSGQSFVGTLSLSPAGDGSYTPAGAPRTLLSFDVTVDVYSFSKEHDDAYPSGPQVDLSGGTFSLISYVSTEKVGNTFLFIAYVPGSATNDVEFRESLESPASTGTLAIVPCP